MWITVQKETERGPGAGGIRLGTLERGSQKALSDVITSLHTGRLICTVEKAGEQLAIADYLQVYTLAVD